MRKLEIHIRKVFYKTVVRIKASFLVIHISRIYLNTINLECMQEGIRINCEPKKSYIEGMYSYKEELKLPRPNEDMYQEHLSESWKRILDKRQKNVKSLVALDTYE